MARDWLDSARHQRDIGQCEKAAELLLHAKKLRARSLKRRLVVDTAWRRVQAGLRDLMNSREVLAAPGVWEFVANLEVLCEDIGASVSDESTCEEAFRRLEAGFRRGHRMKQDAPRLAAKAWVRREWAQHAGEYKSKADFGRIFARRLKQERGIQVTDREVSTRWLQGL